MEDYYKTSTFLSKLLMMPIIKDQHYVPQFYLNYFSNQQKQLYVFDKKTEKSFIRNVKKLAQENYFYDSDEIDEKTCEFQYTEKYLNTFETTTSNLLSQFFGDLLHQRIDCLQDYVRNQLCNYLVLQIFRTKEFRTDVTQSFENFTVSVRNAFFTSLGVTPPDTSDVNEQAKAKEFQIEQLVNDTDFKKSLYDILNAHIWIIYVNCTDIPYYTSDNPIVKYPHLYNHIRPNSGYKSEGIEIAFPLSPTCLLALYERNHFNKHEKYDNNIVIESDPKRIEFYNSLQVSQSYRQIFCSIDSFELASEMLTTHKDLADIDRPRYGNS